MTKAKESGQPKKKGLISRWLEKMDQKKQSIDLGEIELNLLEI